jgi:hypothetical protein
MSQISKLGYVDAKLGAPTSGQQTTRIIFNSVPAPANWTTLTFFKNFQGLTPGQTNLTQNKLDSMESMVIKTITLMSLNADGALVPVGGVTPTQGITVSVIVGNQQVVKNLPIQFNQSRSGQAFDRLHENGGVQNNTIAGSATAQIQMPSEIRLLTDIVIPPQVAFEVRVDATAGIGGGGDSKFVCVLGGYGKIFSAGSSF